MSSYSVPFGCMGSYVFTSKKRCVILNNVLYPDKIVDWTLRTSSSWMELNGKFRRRSVTPAEGVKKSILHDDIEKSP